MVQDTQSILENSEGQDSSITSDSAIVSPSGSKKELILSKE